MKPGNRALLVVVVAVVVVTAIGGAYFLLTGPPTSLPISAGTVLGGGYAVRFTVSGRVGRFIGAWHLDRGGIVTIVWSNYSGPPVPGPQGCLTNGSWDEYANFSLVPGTYIMSFVPVGPGGTLLVTQTLQILYPGDAPGTNGTILASWCPPPVS